MPASTPLSPNTRAFTFCTAKPQKRTRCSFCATARHSTPAGARRSQAMPSTQTASAAAET